MSGISTVIKSLHLEGTGKGTITVSHLEQPYGPDSHSVCSVGVSLTGDPVNPDWKVHIPYTQIDAICEALQEAKSKA